MVTHILSNSQQAPHDPPTQKDASLENVGQGVAEPLASLLESLSDALSPFDPQVVEALRLLLRHPAAAATQYA